MQAQHTRRGPRRPLRHQQVRARPVPFLDSVRDLVRADWDGVNDNRVTFTLHGGGNLLDLAFLET